MYGSPACESARTSMTQRQLNPHITARVHVHCCMASCSSSHSWLAINTRQQAHHIKAATSRVLRSRACFPAPHSGHLRPACQVHPAYLPVPRRKRMAITMLSTSMPAETAPTQFLHPLTPTPSAIRNAEHVCNPAKVAPSSAAHSRACSAHAHHSMAGMHLCTQELRHKRWPAQLAAAITAPLPLQPHALLPRGHGRPRPLVAPCPVAQHTSQCDPEFNT